MAGEAVALLDSDTLSELSRGNPRVTLRAREYLTRHGRFSFSAVTVFERLRGYRLALREGRPYEQHLARFEELVARSVILPVDERVAAVAAAIWSKCPARLQRATGDILIAATAAANGMRLVSRNRRDFERLLSVSDQPVQLDDWSR